MKNSSKISYKLKDINKAVDWLKDLAQRYKILCFYGDLGAGKTTLVRALLKDLGVRDSVVSPTYTYVRSYVGDDGTLFHHFDLYRIADLTSFYESGFDEMIEQQGVKVFVEWPEVIEPILKNDFCEIRISSQGDDERVLESFCS
ncbi:MAG: P-loop hydrolase [candidate division TM6 bacterium GW2011_GWF2_32_72]|nr:MAG: P-loop hydrolase [candidate division TM6 bacterium GW2011_GWF2_32_72]